MGRNAERIVAVKTLRGIALQCGVERVADFTGKQAVQGMMNNIRASGGPDAKKAEAEDAFKQFMATYSQQGEEGAKQEAPVRHLTRTQAGKRVAERCAKGLRKVCQEVIRKRGRASSG